MENSYPFIGIDLGGTNMRVGKILNGALLQQNAVPTPKQAKTCEETIEALVALISSVMDKDVRAIGIGVPSV